MCPYPALASGRLDVRCHYRDWRYGEERVCRDGVLVALVEQTGRRSADSMVDFFTNEPPICPFCRLDEWVAQSHREARERVVWMEPMSTLLLRAWLAPDIRAWHGLGAFASAARQDLLWASEDGTGTVPWPWDIPDDLQVSAHLLMELHAIFANASHGESA